MNEIKNFSKECADKITKDGNEMVKKFTPIFEEFLEKWYKNGFNFSQVLSRFGDEFKPLTDEIAVSRKNENGKYQISINVSDYSQDEITIELNRSERIVTVEASHKVEGSSNEGSTYHNSRCMKVVETIPDYVDIYSLKKEFKNNQLIIIGNDIEECDDTENIVKL